MQIRRIGRATGPLDATLRAMPSKSVTHRALVAAALADGVSTLHDPLDADDTRATLEGLAALGIGARTEPARWIVHGAGGEVPGGGRLALRDSGTSLRFLTAVAALGRAPSHLDGSQRLRERPVQELARALTAIGGTVRLGSTPGGLPLLAGGSAPAGAEVRLPGGRSSQFASALLLIGPRLARGVDVRLEPPVVSLPYVELSAQVLADFGVGVERVDHHRFRVRRQRFAGRDYRIEGDHSSASYFLAAAAIVGGRVRVRGLAPDSAQPDARLGAILRDLGCGVETGDDWIEVAGRGPIPGFDLDMAEAPDLVPTLAVLALFASGPCTLSGIPHLRHKESDRLAVLASNIESLGGHATVLAGGLRVHATASKLIPARIRCSSDHRMAMAFAVAGLRLDGLEVDEPDCVAKSNPEFWEQFAQLTARAEL